MTHLHLPDGVLPWWLWVPGLVAAAALLWWVTFRHRADGRERLALLGTMSGLMLAAMALPLGPLGYHLSLAPVVGIVLGGGLAFVAACVVNAALALVGHGGFTVVGLNALVTGSAAALGGWVYRALKGRTSPFWAAAAAAATGMLGSLVLFLVVIWLAGTAPNPSFDSHEGARGSTLEQREASELLGADSRESGWRAASRRLARFAIPSVPFWILGTLAEALVAGGIVGFLARVNPSLLAGHSAALAARAP